MEFGSNLFSKMAHTYCLEVVLMIGNLKFLGGVVAIIRNFGDNF